MKDIYVFTKIIRCTDPSRKLYLYKMKNKLYCFSGYVHMRPYESYFKKYYLLNKNKKVLF